VVQGHVGQLHGSPRAPARRSRGRAEAARHRLAMHAGYRITSSYHVVLCCRCRYSTVPPVHDRDAHARSSTMRPRAACPTSRGDSEKSVSSRPCIALPACTHSRVGAVRWHPPLCRVSCFSIDTHPPHHLQWLPDKPCLHCLHMTELQQPPPYAPTPACASTRCLSVVEC
jgi:hypothetical protein